MLSVIMLSVISECRYAECRNVTHSNEGPRLLRYGINYGRQKLYDTGPGLYMSTFTKLTNTSKCYKTFYLAILMQGQNKLQCLPLKIIFSDCLKFVYQLGKCRVGSLFHPQILDLPKNVC
jgi:hypothetical protein